MKDVMFTWDVEYFFSGKLKKCQTSTEQTLFLYLMGILGGERRPNLKGFDILLLQQQETIH